MHFNAVVCCRPICQRGQTHTELFYVGAAGRRNGLCERRGTHVLALKHAAPRLRGLRLGLQTRAGHGPDGAHEKRWSFPRLESVCVPSRWKVLSGEFRRRPTVLAIKFRKPDRVGRRGLSEPREDFSRLNTYAIPWLYLRLFPQLDSACPRSA